MTKIKPFIDDKGYILDEDNERIEDYISREPILLSDTIIIQNEINDINSLREFIAIKNAKRELPITVVGKEEISFYDIFKIYKLKGNFKLPVVNINSNSLLQEQQKRIDKYNEILRVYNSNTIIDNFVELLNILFIENENLIIYPSSINTPPEYLKNKTNPYLKYIRYPRLQDGVYLNEYISDESSGNMGKG